MTAPGRVRPITLDDIEGYRACLDRVARERIHIAFTEAPSVDQVKFFVASMIQRDLPFYVADDGGRVVGWCDIFVAPENPQRPGFGHRGTLGMGLDAGFRGRGLGEALLGAALEHARRIGLERVELQVYATNEPAIALYRKFGFETEGVKRRARKLDGRYDDIIQMARLRPPQQG